MENMNIGLIGNGHFGKALARRLEAVTSAARGARSGNTWQIASRSGDFFYSGYPYRLRRKVWAIAWCVR